MLNNVIKNDVKSLFHYELKELNKKLKDGDAAYIYNNNLFPKHSEKEIERLIWELLKYGFKIVNWYSPFKDKLIIDKLYNQLKRAIKLKTLIPKIDAASNYKRLNNNNEEIKIEWEIPNTKKRIDILNGREIIEIKNIDFTLQGNNTTIFFMKYLYQVIEYMILCKINNVNILNTFIIWLPRFNFIKRFRINESYLDKWIKDFKESK